MTAFRVPPETKMVIPLRERNGAPRHLDDKTAAVVRSTIESILGPLQEQHREEMRAMREIAERMERGYTNLAEKLEAFVIGDEDVAVAAVVDGESGELPNLPRYKAEATVVYRFTAKDIGDALGGIPHMQVAYFLGPFGLNWSASKENMWNKELFRMTKRRLWHPDIVALLAGVILGPDHPERELLSSACLKRMDSCRPILQRRVKPTG